jgi:mannose-6-phosphate isomerase-like protein (cupin superfamily)
MQSINELNKAEIESFQNDVVAADSPAVIRSLVEDWPAVIRGRGSAADICRYIEGLDDEKLVYTIAAPPEAGSRFFYSEDLRSLNFKRGQIPLRQVLAQLLAQVGATEAHSIAVQSLPVREILPGFERQNPVPLLDQSIEPTMWIGNQGKVAPHYDVHRNLACVVAGRRRFTLFPPEQVENLYPGPVLGAPGGVPVSLVNVWSPELEKFPRYAAALEVAQETVLEPGDAIYIPSLWWHAVESLESVNVLVNYWWGGINQHGVSPNDSLLHGMLTIAGLDKTQRRAWRDFFDYYVFRSGENPGEHLPDGLHDIVTSMSPEQVESVRQFLAQKLLKSG